LDRVEERAGGFETNGQMAVGQGSQNRDHPVVLSVCRHVFDIACDRFSAFQKVPDQPVDSGRHVRMSDQIMRPPDEGFLPVATDAAEHLIAGANDAPVIGGGEKQFLNAEGTR
jgi:hypothetical protein